MGDERRDDWKSGVDDRLMSLTSSQRTTDDQLDDLELKYEALDRVMRGNPEEDTDGLIARLHNVENGLQELRAERMKDRMGEVSVKGVKWQVWGTILAAIITTGGLLMINLSKIKEAFQGKEAHYQPSKKLLREIQKDKELHRRKKPPSANGPNSTLLPPAASQDLK